MITIFILFLINIILIYLLYSNKSLENYENYDEVVSLFSGNTDPILFPNGYDQEGQIYLTGSGVFPATILAIIYQLHTQDR